MTVCELMKELLKADDIDLPVRFSVGPDDYSHADKNEELNINLIEEWPDRIVLSDM